MATRVELNKETIRHMLEARIIVLKRQASNTPNQMIKEIIGKDVAEATAALSTLSEVK